MKRVAVTQRIDRILERGETRDALDQRVLSWLIQADALGFPVPNIWSTPNAFYTWLRAVRPEAILLTGGEDLGRSRGRDDTERALLRFAQENHMPALGLCRGLQMMCVFANGKLEKVDHHLRCRHSLVHMGPMAFPIDVNSYHSWGLKVCPPGYEILARAPDGSIEAIRHVELPWEGWMWHPERESTFAISDLDRLRSLLEEA